MPIDLILVSEDNVDEWRNVPGHVDRGDVVARAVFPGPHGRVYRRLVIGTRGHVLAVRRELGAIKRRAELS